MRGLQELKAQRAAVVVFYVLLASSMIYYGFQYYAYTGPKFHGDQSNQDEASLKKLLRRASMLDKKAVIVTILDEESATPGSVFNIFLEGFKVGHGIKKFLNNIVVFTVDSRTHEYCKSLHPHCFNLDTYRTNSTWVPFKDQNHPKLGWRMVDIVGEIIDIGYSVLFTETDVLWVRNPFSHIKSKAEIATARDKAQSKVSDLGFFFVASNDRTVEFFKYWKMSSILYPNTSHESVFEIIKEDSYTKKIELRIEYLDAHIFNSFCEPNGHMICTLHAKCSGSSERKVQNLRQILDIVKNSSVLTRQNGLIKTSSA